MTPVLRSDNRLIYQNRRFERFSPSLKEECGQHLFPSFAAARREMAAGIAATTRRARIKPRAIGTHANIGPNKVDWWFDFGGPLHN